MCGDRWCAGHIEAAPEHQRPIVAARCSVPVVRKTVFWCTSTPEEDNNLYNRAKEQAMLEWSRASESGTTREASPSGLAARTGLGTTTARDPQGGAAPGAAPAALPTTVDKHSPPLRTLGTPGVELPELEVERPLCAESVAPPSRVLYNVATTNHYRLLQEEHDGDGQPVRPPQAWACAGGEQNFCSR